MFLKVLVLDEWIPYPLVSGKRLRTYHLLSRAARNHNITYLCFADPTDDEGRKQIQSLGIKLVTLPYRNPFVPKYRLVYFAAANLFSSSPVVMRKHFRSDYLNSLNKLVKEEGFDLLHCEWTHYGAYVHSLTDLPRFLSSHNIEAMPWRRLYQHEKNPLKRVFLFLEWRKMLRFERRVCRDFDHIGAVSEEDRRVFETLYDCRSVTVVPNGIDVGYYQFAPPNLAGKSLVFSASFDAFVNQDAAVYFLQSIFPKILEKSPAVTMTFLGKDPPPFLRRYESPRVHFTGTVEDVRPHIAQSSVCVVPIRIAGGSRIKILEAMAAGLPVVSTPEGAEGLGITEGEHILIARGADEFANCVVNLLNDESQALSLTSKARKLVEECYDWEKIAPLLERAWSETISRFKQRVALGT